MTQEVATLIVRVEELLQSRLYPDAQRALALVDQSSLNGDDLAIYCILMTEVSLFLGDYNIDLLDYPMDRYRRTDPFDRYGRAKYLRGWRLSSLGRNEEAQETLVEAYAAFLRVGDRAKAARTLNRLAYVLQQLGRTDNALANLEKAVEIQTDLGNSASAAVGRSNIFAVHLLAGNLNRAMEVLQQIDERVSDLGPRDAANFYGNSSLMFSMLGRAGDARCRLEMVRTLVSDFSHQQALYFENLGFLYLLTGEHKKCKDALDDGLKISLQIAPESALVSQIKRLLGDLSIATKKYKQAHKHATEALAVAEKIGQRVEIAACWRIFAQVESHNGNYQTARDWFHKAIDLFNQISARYELAVARYLAATSGAFDASESSALLYLAKEYFESEQVAPYIERVDAALKLRPSAPAGLTDPLKIGEDELITNDRRMKTLLDIAEHVAPTTMTVLLTGETGTGKDLLAKYIHLKSGRTGRFLSQNFAALPSSLAESELFGHKRGSFTGSSDDKIGLFEASSGGTFYLNEVADAPMDLQCKLLEVLENRKIRRLGEIDDRPLDLRIVAATNHDLGKAVREGRFRADLFHRLNEVNIHLPSLAERPGDIPLLVRYFLSRAGVQNGQPEQGKQIDRIARLLTMRPWPGNIRQLGAQVKTWAVLAGGNLDGIIELIMQEPLPEVPVEETIETQLARALDASEWNQTRAADLLGISEGSIRKRMRKFGFDKD